MRTGVFTYASWSSRFDQRLRVRECPDPAAVQRMLMELLQRQVTWRETPRV